MSRSLLFSWPSVLLVACLIVLSGCHYYAGSGYSYSIQVTAVADNETVASGMTVSLTSDYDIDDAEVYITDQDWSVIMAPPSAVFTFDDDGRDATLTPTTAGTYYIRYRTWYYTNWDYYDCYCTHPTGYRESYVTITVGAALST